MFSYFKRLFNRPTISASIREDDLNEPTAIVYPKTHLAATLDSKSLKSHLAQPLVYPKKKIGREAHHTFSDSPTMPFSLPVDSLDFSQASSSNDTSSSTPDTSSSLDPGGGDSGGGGASSDW